MQVDDVLTTVLARPSYGSRARCLRGRRALFSAELVDGFLAQAHDVMRSDPAKARQLARLALYVARTLDGNAIRGRCLRALCQAGLVSGHYPEALRSVDAALEMLGVEAESVTRAELQSLRVQILTQLEQFTEARRTGEQALGVFERHGQRSGIIRARMALAALATQVAAPREALAHYAAVQRLLPPTAKPSLRAALAANRANALQACHRFRAAGRWYAQARAIFAEEDCAHTVAQMDYNLAHAQLLRGNYEEALRRFEEVQAAFERFGDGMHLAHVDLDRAEVHLIMNMPAEAQTHALRAAERFAALGLGKDRAQAEYFAGRAAAMQGRLEEAIALYAGARRSFASAGLVPFEVNCIVQQAYASQRLGRAGPAQLLAEEADALLGSETNPLTVATVEVLRAHLHLAAGLPARAQLRAQDALARSRHIHAPWLHVEALRVLGLALRARGRDAAARAALQQAVDLLEGQRGGVPPDEYMSAFLSARSELYAQLLDLLVEQGRVREAFEICQRAKSRALLDRLARGPGGPDAPEASPRVRFLRESLSAVYWHLFRAGGGADPAADDDMAAKHREAAVLEAELARLLRARSLKRSAARPGESVDMPSIEDIQAALDGDTALIEYFLTEGAVVAFVVTRDRLDMNRRPVEGDELERGLLRLRFHLARHEREELLGADLLLQATRANLGRLRAILLDPLAAHLDVQRLVIAPHGVLHGLPFHALPWGGGWLTDRYDVVSVPSAAVYLQCSRVRPRALGDAVVFGVPDAAAPEIEAECRTLARTLGTGLLFLGEQATFDVLRRTVAGARIVHIAAHGMFRREHPTLSGLGLADRWITLHDFHELDIGAQLVVLSTCESGTAGVTRGGEVLGISRGVLSAGAPALLCSQWRVRDGVTAAFMTSFYDALALDPNVAAAHGRAMAEIRRSHPHPYYWAPFFLMGCPDTTPHTAPPGRREVSLVSPIEGNA